MAITLRTVTGSALTYEQVDTNFSSLIHSASISGNQLTLHYTSSGFAPSNLTLPIESASYAQTSSIAVSSSQAVSSSFAITSSMTLAVLGTNNYVPKFSGSRNIVDSSIEVSGPQVHINPETTLENSAILQIDSTNRGVLFPRMTSTQRNNISDPAEGLIVWDITLRQLCIRVSTSWYTFDLTAI